MKAYKLFRLKSTGEITSLFINKSEPIVLNKWLEAKLFPTEGFAVRHGWHCVPTPHAPHLTNKGRVWAEIEIKSVKRLTKPKSQGGLWYLAKTMKVNRLLGEMGFVGSLP